MAVGLCAGEGHLREARDACHLARPLQLLALSSLIKALASRLSAGRLGTAARHGSDRGGCSAPDTREPGHLPLAIVSQHPLLAQAAPGSSSHGYSSTAANTAGNGAQRRVADSAGAGVVDCSTGMWGWSRTRDGPVLVPMVCWVPLALSCMRWWRWPA